MKKTKALVKKTNNVATPKASAKTAAPKIMGTNKMTDQQQNNKPQQPSVRRPVRRRKRLSPIPVVIASVTTFAVSFSLLAWQLTLGHDPALGALNKQGSVPAKKVLIRKIIRKKVVVIDPAPKTQTVKTSSNVSSAPAATTSSSSGSYVAPQAAVTQTQAPVAPVQTQVAPVQTSAPRVVSTPAPTPTVVTRAS